MIGRWIMGGLGAAVAAFAALAYVQSERADALAAKNASLSRTVAVYKAQAEQAAEARRVAQAHAERWQARAAEYEAELADLTKGVKDAPLDPRLRDRLNRLLAD